MQKSRKARIKSVEETDGLPGFMVFEREAGTGARDEVQTKSGYHYFRHRYWTEDAKGVPKRKSVYGKTEAILEKKVKIARASTSRTAEVSKMTIETYFNERFLPGAEPTIRPATFASYKNAVYTRIAPMIGKAKFATLTPDKARAWIAEMQKSGRGRRADQVAVQILKRGYIRAFDDGLITSNPIASVKPPKATPREKDILDLKETIRFLRTIRLSKTDADWFPLMYCAVSLGMREGELFGLTWAKVDLAGRRVRVVEQCGPLADGTTLGQVPVKTETSKRTLYLDDLTVRALEMQKRKHPTLVFPNRKGGYILKRTVNATVVPRLLSASGLGRDRAFWFHLLRGGAASILSSEDISTPKIDKWLGHSISGIAGKYIKIGDSDLDSIAKVMARLLKPVWK